MIFISVDPTCFLNARTAPSDKMLKMKLPTTICGNKLLIINCDCYIAITETSSLNGKNE